MLYAAREPEESESGLSLVRETQYYIPLSRKLDRYSKCQASSQELAYK